MKNRLFVIVLIIFFNSCSKEDVFPRNNSVNLSLKLVAIKTLGGDLNEVANSVVATPDGGYIVSGFSQSNNGDIVAKNDTSFDFWVVKFSSEDTIEWQKNYGGSEDDRASKIIQTSDGNFVVLGYTRSLDNNITTNAGAQDFWLIKIDTNGNLLWEKTYGFSGLDYGTTLLETNDGGLLIAGVLDVTASKGEGNAKSLAIKHAGGDYWVIKTDNRGNLEWSKYFGGSFTDVPLGIVKTLDNHFILVGTSDSNDFNIKNNKGSYDFWAIKIASSGELVWEKSFGGSEIDEARCITNTFDGNFVIVGDTRSADKDIANNNGGADIWILKIDTNGNIIWEKTFGGTDFDAARSISKTQDNGFIISGSSRSVDGNFTNKGQNDALLLKINATGNMVWQQTLGGSKIDYLYDAIEIGAHIIAVGESSSSDKDIKENKGFSDALVIKIKN